MICLSHYSSSILGSVRILLQVYQSATGWRFAVCKYLGNIKQSVIFIYLFVPSCISLWYFSTNYKCVSSALLLNSKKFLLLFYCYLLVRYRQFALSKVIQHEALRLRKKQLNNKICFACNDNGVFTCYIKIFGTCTYIVIQNI